MKLEIYSNRRFALGVFLLSFLALFSGALFSQTTISGTVTDATGQTLIGASVVVKGTDKGTVTDANGRFNLDGNEGAVLSISYTGYVSAEVAATNNMSVSLEEGTTLGEVLVTAQKRGENMQRSPISISVLNGPKIAERGIASLDNALRTVPGLEVQQVAQGSQLFIRGIGSSIDPTFADPSVALMVDGVYNGRTEILQGGVFDINRIEVLRGPQGTLYGRNATGGTVNVITNDPNLAGNEGSLRLSAGNYSMKKAEAMYNLALSDKFAVRLSGFWEDRNGYIDDGSEDMKSGAGRLKFLYKASQKISILGKVEVYRRGGNGANTVPVPGSAGKLFFPPPFFVSNFDPSIMGGPPFTGGVPILRFPNGWEPTDPGNKWSNNPEHVAGEVERKSEAYSLQIDADLGKAGNLTILPGISHSYSRLLSNYLFGSIVPFAGPTFDKTPYTEEEANVRYSSVETRLSSKETSKLKYLLGLYYLRSGPLSGYETIPNIANSLSGQAINTANTLQPSKTFAAFAQATYPVSDKFRVTGGLRYSTDKSGQGYSIEIDGVASGSDEFNQTVDNVQYKLGLEADLAEKSMLYAHVATGFKQGGIVATIPTRTFKPETLTSYELGVKNRFWDDRFQLNFSAFFYDFNDYQIWYFEVLPIGDVKDSNGNPVLSNFLIIDNAGNSKIKGAELDVVLAPWKDGIFTLSATLIDAEYGELTLPNNPFVDQGDYPLKGKQVQNSPSNTFNLGFSQGIDLGKGTLTFGVTSKISSSYYASHELYMPGGLQDAYTRTNANLNYQIKKFNFGFFLNNIENGIQTLFPFPAYRRFVSSPRHFGVIAAVRF